MTQKTLKNKWTKMNQKNESNDIQDSLASSRSSGAVISDPAIVPPQIKQAHGRLNQ